MPDMDPQQKDVARRGRPTKFGRPSRAVAVTLPDDVIEALRRVHRDLGWAIVKLLQHDAAAAKPPTVAPQPDVELVAVTERQYLIVVNYEVIRHLPGVNIVPLGGNRAFLALDVDRGMSDLELAVIDRLRHVTLDRRERQALITLRTHLGGWRGDPGLQVRTRAIIVVERRAAKGTDGVTATTRRPRRGFAKTWALPTGLASLMHSAGLLIG
jgi:hypothetical protein